MIGPPFRAITNTILPGPHPAPEQADLPRWPGCTGRTTSASTLRKRQRQPAGPSAPSSAAPGHQPKQPPGPDRQQAETRNAADLTEIRTIVWYIAPGAAKALNILEVKGFAQLASLVADKPGRYHLDTRIIPRHLRKWLKGLGDHADSEQRWLVSNPIAIQ